MMRIKAKKLNENLQILCALEEKYKDKVQFMLEGDLISVYDITSPKKRKLKSYGVTIINFRSDDFAKECNTIEKDIKSFIYYVDMQDSKGIKLTNEQVFDILAKWGKGVKADILAEQYDVSVGTIYNIVNNRSRLKTIFSNDTQ